MRKVCPQCGRNLQRHEDKYGVSWDCPSCPYGDWESVTEWHVTVGGSPEARKRWPSSVHKTEEAARSRRRRIIEARHPGVETVWITSEQKKVGESA